MKEILEILFDGYCPQCQLKKTNEEMYVNSDDFWECKNCHLQMTAFPPYATILRWRGKGQFKIHEYKATDYNKGLVITRPSCDPKMEIYPDQSELLTNTFDLEEYLTLVSDNYKDYQDSLFNPNSPELLQQASRLEEISDEEWENVIELFKTRKDKSRSSEEFQQLHDMLYEIGLVFSFNWISWCKGQKDLADPKYDFSTASLLDLSMYITVIFRSDRFNDISINEALATGILNNIFKRLEELT